jgi:hypothetical protein
METAADVDHFAGREGKLPFGERRDGLADVVRRALPQFAQGLKARFG